MKTGYFKAFCFYTLLCAFVLGIVAGCQFAYKPDVDIENAKINSQSGNKTQMKGEVQWH